MFVYQSYDSGLVLYNLFTNILCIMNVIILNHSFTIDKNFVEFLFNSSKNEKLLSEVIR